MSLSNIKTLLLFVLGFWIILLSLEKCSSVSYKDNFNNTFKPEVINSKTIKDSVRTHYERHIDSLVTELSFTSNVPLVKSEPITQYVFLDRPIDSTKIDLSDTNEFYYGKRVFYYEKKDSLLNYTIHVTSDKKPDNVSINYKLKLLTIHDSTYVRDSINETTTNKVRVNQIYFGGEAIIYPGLSGVFAGADLINKRGWQFEVGVGILNDKTIAGKVGFKKLISFRNVKRN